jgi:hypothetical protein
MPAFFSTWAFWGEVAKLVAQLGGALLIAWLTVRWALGRYKSEKMWERRTTALFDLLTAISEVHRVNSEWLQQELLRHDYAEHYSERLTSAFWSGKQRIDEIASITDILLPEAREAIATLRAELDKDRPVDDSYQEMLEQRIAALAKARDSLVSIGRARVKG